MLSRDDIALMDYLHGGFPVSERPYLEVAHALGWTEEKVLARLQALLSQGMLTRFGPLFQIERAGGRFVLAAVAVPEDRFEAVASQINAFAEVAHNYRREHHFNMWFVVAAETAEDASNVIEKIEHLTGLRVLAFPKEEEYFVELRLPLQALAEGAL